MIEALLVALILCAIVCVIAGAFVKIVPMPHPAVPTVVWAVVAVICLLLLLNAITGDPITLDFDRG